MEYVENPPPPRLYNHSTKPIARIFHELLAATTDMAVLPGALGCRTLRRTVKYASDPTPCGCPVAQPSSRSRDGNS